MNGALIIVVFGFLAVLCLSDQCFDPERNVQGLTYDQKLEEYPFISFNAMGPLDCYTKCRLYTLCQSANFDSNSHLCELLPVSDGNFLSTINYIFININSWTKDILNSCSGHHCSNNTYCREDGSSYLCVPIGCVGVPDVTYVNVTSFNSRVIWSLNDSVEYPCIAGYYPTSNPHCNSIGMWSQFECRPFKNCADFYKCNYSYSDEDSLIFINKMSTWLKVHCLENNSSFLTLHHPTFSTYPMYTRGDSSCTKIPVQTIWLHGMGHTSYQKVRFKPFIGELPVINTMFANTSNIYQSLGSALDCYAGNNASECGVLGHFVIDLRETGVRIKDDVQWVTKGNDSVIFNITKSHNGQIIEGYCGGNCGGCQPDVEKDLPVEANPHNVPDMTLAFSCLKRFDV